MRKLAAVIAVTVGLVTTCSAGPVTLTFQLSEIGVPNGPCGSACPSVNGLTVEGVTFGFTGSSLPFPQNQAVYGFDLGVPGQNIQDPVLEGPSDGTLAVTFASPTSFLQFYVALAVGSSESPGFSVELSGPGFMTATDIPVDTSVPPGFLLSEGRFSSNGPLISKAVITFSQNDQNPAFALDNLTFNAAGVGAPEPQPFALLGSGLLLVGILTRFRRV
jgi:hypothetical protein